MAEALTIYEFWEVIRPTMPPSSQFYHLAPVGVGTSAVESLTSYTARLAEAHSVWPKTLVQGILSRFGRSYLFVNPERKTIQTTFWKKNVRALNATGEWARDWIQILEQLTLRNDLRFLTMLTWAEVVPFKNLMRHTRAWCPACYQAWSTTGQVVYEPLLWALQVVTICPRHHCYLHHHCPHPGCHRTLPLLGPKARPGHCSYCQQWLGASPKGRASGFKEPDQVELGWQRWVAEAVGELLAAAPSLSTVLHKDILAQNLSICYQHVAQRKLARLVDTIRVYKTTLRKWLCGQRVPQFELLLRLCYSFSVSPLEVMTLERVAPGARQVRPLPEGDFLPRRRVHARPFDPNAMAHALEAILASDEEPPPSVAEVAKRFGYDNAYLAQRLPIQCRAISARFQAYQKANRARKLQQLCAEVRQATLSIGAQGVYPSTTKVAASLDRRWYLCSPEAKTAWRQALQELGWTTPPS